MMPESILGDRAAHPPASSRWPVIERFARWGEPLWVTALILVFVVRGMEWIPTLIQLAGRGGRVETAEWLDYLLLGSLFPVIAAGIGAVAPKRIHRRWLVVLLAALSAFAVGYGFRYLAGSGTSTLFAALGLGAATTATVWGMRRRAHWDNPGLVSSETFLWLITLSLAWGAALRIATWVTGAQWLMQSVSTPIILALLIVATIQTFIVTRADPALRWRPSVADVPALLAIVALSFRTNLVAEFYHWSFWVGPIEAVRQGGWLLWDVPSQYGFFSILVPSLIPARAGWIPLYIVQSALYAIVGAGMFLFFRSFRRDYWGYATAFALTATTLFFRPRSETLILAAQVTPAGGPMRFLWCYVLCGVLLWKYDRGEKVSPARFAIVGTLVWLMAVLWSVESAIYGTAAWFSALIVFLLQQQFPARLELRSRRHPLLLALLPIGAVIAAAVLLAVIYRAADGHGPDWINYLEYALLFSGGYSALPIQPQESIGYLLSIFALVSTAVVAFFAADPRHPRVFVAAGAWGTVWGVSSYFVSRSHPVNLLSLAPVLLCAAGLVLYCMGPHIITRWGYLARLSFVPLVAMPAALSLAHDQFLPELTRPQMSPSRIPSQVPAMDSSLFSLVRQTTMKPGDAAFFVSEGKFIMPPWPAAPDGSVETNATSWMPKPYEMISTLPAHRRDAYIDRFVGRMRLGGWLVQRKADINPAYSDLLKKLGDTHRKVESHENKDWIVDRYEWKGEQPIAGR